MSENKKFFLIAITVAMAAQVHLNFFIPGFIITLSVIVLGTLIYIMDANPVKACLLTAFISPLFRAIIEFLLNGDLKNIIYLISPDIIFYLVYAVCIYFFYKYCKENLVKYFLLVFFSELIGNIIEIGFRVQNANGFTYETFKFLVIIALIRSTVVVVLISGFKYYKLLLTSEEHDRRYQKLLMKKAYFESEIYFMKKNIDDIEKTMKKAYQLYKLTQNSDSEIRNLSLDIAKNIHEVKKDYIRVVDGLSEIADEDVLNKNSFNIIEIIDIIKLNSIDLINKNEKNIYLNFHSKSKLDISKHYLLVSVLRNLIDNSIDAIEKKGDIKILVENDNENMKLEISDTGGGIPKDQIDYIFEIGYSSKFSDKTGKSNRGMGLTIVKEIIENKFEGRMEVVSDYENWTKFNIYIPLEEL